MIENLDLHDWPAAGRHRLLDGNLIAALVFCFRHIEYGQDRRDSGENYSLGKVTSGTDPLANTKRQRESWVVSDAPIFVEKALRFEFLWVWVYLWVM